MHLRVRGSVRVVRNTFRSKTLLSLLIRAVGAIRCVNPVSRRSAALMRGRISLASRQSSTTRSWSYKGGAALSVGGHLFRVSGSWPSTMTTSAAGKGGGVRVVFGVLCVRAVIRWSDSPRTTPRHCNAPLTTWMTHRRAGSWPNTEQRPGSEKHAQGDAGVIISAIQYPPGVGVGQGKDQGRRWT